jgi:hypothetical protein
VDAFCFDSSEIPGEVVDYLVTRESVLRERGDTQGNFEGMVPGKGTVDDRRAKKLPAW